MHVAKKEESLGVYFPNPALYQYCFEYTIDLKFRPGLELQALDLGADWAHVIIEPRLGLSITSGTNMNVDVGSIVSGGSIYSKHSDFQVLVGAITGNYTLERNLRLASAVGDIDAHVAPNSSRTIEWEDAHLDVATNVGSINVDFPYTGYGHLAEREYFTHIHAGKSGKVTGQYLLGSHMTIDGAAAEIDIDVLPYLITNSSASHACA